MRKFLKDVGSPLQPMLVVFPIVFYTAAFTSFIAYQIYSKVFWFHLAYTANVAGVLTALVAMIPAMATWWFEDETHAYEKKEDITYMALNFVALVMFSLNLWMQADKWDLARPEVGYSILISGIGLISAYLAGFFGWDLVQKYQVEEELTSHMKDSRRTTLSPSLRGSH